MGINSLITWAVIDPVMRVVITEMQGSSAVETRAATLAFSCWGNAWVSFAFGWNVSFKFCVKFYVRRGLRALRLGHCGEAEMQVSTLASGAAVMLRRGFQALRLGHHSDVETRVWTLVSWCCVSGLRLESRLCFLMTCPQWFLNSLQSSLWLFSRSTKSTDTKITNKE